MIRYPLPIRRPILPGPMPVLPGAGGGSVGPIVVPIRQGPILPGPMPVLNLNPTAGGSCSPGQYGAPGWRCVNGQWQVVGDANPMPPILPPAHLAPLPSGGGGSVGPIMVVSAPDLPVFPSPPPSSGAIAAAPPATVAPAPVNVNIASAPSLYQEIFDWLKQDTSLFGFTIPNWMIGVAGVGVAYKFTGKH